jgi:hypothetical protein
MDAKISSFIIIVGLILAATGVGLGAAHLAALDVEDSRGKTPGGSNRPVIRSAGEFSEINCLNATTLVQITQNSKNCFFLLDSSLPR